MPKPDPREARKEMDEGQTQGEKEPQDGDESQQRPRDPEDRGQADPGDPTGEQGERRPNVPAWVVGLPPQLRDAFVRGNFEMVPEEYRELVDRYRLWLLKQEAKENR